MDAGIPSLNNAEAVEANYLNNGGTSTGVLQGVLATGSSSGGSMQFVVGVNSQFANSGGTIFNFAHFNCGTFSGTLPTNYYCLENQDANAIISTSGPIS